MSLENLPMNNSHQYHIEQLRLLDLSLRSQLQQAEARVPSINAIIAELAKMQGVPEYAILGLILYEGLTNVLTGPNESGQVVQVALTVPGGFGVVNWSSEEFATYCKTPPKTSAGIFRLFIPFDRCPSAVKALLLPHVQPLLDLFLHNIRTANREPE